MKRGWRDVLDFLCEYPLWCLMGLSVVGGGVMLVVSYCFTGFPLAPLFWGLMGVPVALTVCNLLLCFASPGEYRYARLTCWVELIGIPLGAVMSPLYASAADISDSDWYVQLYNGTKHTPIFSEAMPTVLVLTLLAVAAYAILRFMPAGKQPPLLTVLCMAALYIGIGLCVVWCVQISGGRSAEILDSILLCLFPANGIVIALRLIAHTVWHKLREPQTDAPTRLRWLHRLLGSAIHWPWLALLAAVPLLGVAVAVLLLFGQEPDSILRAWTETAGWSLSEKVALPNVQTNEHYLCTVAAGGHRRLVKPLRPGVRRGHCVVVNRQLCVANAFEQLLEERTPRFHRLVRGLYDRLGYPIARHIRSPYVADAIYIVMKPAEWMFLTVLYLFDRKPENRIAVQYPHSTPPKV